MVGASASRQAILAAIACGICMGLGLATLFVGTFPVFLVPVSRQFGWGLAVFPRAIMSAAIATALFGPLAGRLIDRYGVLPFMLAGLATWGACLGAYSIVPGNALMIYVLPALIGVSGSLCGPVPLAKVVSGWFDKNRGLVLGLVLSAAPAATTAVAVLGARELILDFGWRAAYRVLGSVVLLVGLPVALLFMREAPTVGKERESQPGTVNRRAASPPGLSTPEALRSLDFWLVVCATALACAAINGLIGHMIAWCNERGISGSLAAVAVSVFSLTGPAGPILAGWLADRLRGPRLLFLFYALPLVGVCMLALAPAYLFIPGAILMGLGFSSTTGLLPYLLTRYFGLRSASELFGIGIGLTTLGMGTGPVLIGWSHDRTGSYHQSLVMIFGVLAVALLVAAMLRPYRFAAHAAEGSERAPHVTDVTASR